MKLLLTLLLLVFPTLAAPWDGTKGPFSVVTFTQPSSAGIAAMGLPSVPGVPEMTVMFIRCTDKTVAGVRVTITYRDDNGHESSTSLLSDFSTGGYGGVNAPIPQGRILSVRLTALRDAETY